MGIDYRYDTGWVFGGLTTSFEEFPDRPRLDLVDWSMGRKANPCWIEDTVTKRHSKRGTQNVGTHLSCPVPLERWWLWISTPCASIWFVVHLFSDSSYLCNGVVHVIYATMGMNRELGAMALWDTNPGIDNLRMPLPRIVRRAAWHGFRSGGRFHPSRGALKFSSGNAAASGFRQTKQRVIPLGLRSNSVTQSQGLSSVVLETASRLLSWSDDPICAEELVPGRAK